jgi:hypothetical protein
MDLQIISTQPQSYAVVDVSVPGGRTIEHHAERERAERAVARLTSQGLATTDGPTDAPERVAEEAGTVDPRRAMLGAVLSGRAADVRARIGRVESAADLATLGELEAEGAGRRTVLTAIEARRVSVVA